MAAAATHQCGETADAQEISQDGGCFLLLPLLISERAPHHAAPPLVGHESAVRGEAT